MDPVVVSALTMTFLRTALAFADAVRSARKIVGEIRTPLVSGGLGTAGCAGASETAAWAGAHASTVAVARAAQPTAASRRAANGRHDDRDLCMVESGPFPIVFSGPSFRLPGHQVP